MLPFWKGKEQLMKCKPEFHTHKACFPCLYRVKDGSQYDLVWAALQNDLNVSLQETGFGEEFGLCCERLWCLCTVRFPLERGTLEGRENTH